MSEIDCLIAIVEEPCDLESTTLPVIGLGSEHLAALQAGQTLARDVQGEYVLFVQLSASNRTTP